VGGKVGGGGADHICIQKTSNPHYTEREHILAIEGGRFKYLYAERKGGGRGGAHSSGH